MGDQKKNDAKKAIDSKDELKMANERRIEELIHLSNRHTRTARHLEQHSDITNLDELKHSFKIQEEREARMNNLKNIIAYGEHDEVDEAKNIKKNYEYTQHYLQHHSAHMDPFTLEKTNEKQEHRKEQMDFLQ